MEEQMAHSIVQTGHPQTRPLPPHPQPVKYVSLGIRQRTRTAVDVHDKDVAATETAWASADIWGRTLEDHA